jgi:hypothetical protein
LTGTAIGLFVDLPPHPTVVDRIIQASKYLGLGLLIVFAWAFIYAILRAPYEQRRMLREKLDSLTKEYDQTQAADVWPRVECSITTHELPNHRTLNLPTFYLVLSNKGNSPAHAVRARVEPTNAGDRPWRILGKSSESNPLIETLASNSDMSFQMIVAADAAQQMRCVVSWADRRGNQENTATVRLSY